MTARWLDKPEDWYRVAATCRESGLVGWDSETYGHDVRKTTPTRRARVHVWSLAVLTGKVHPRGHRVAAGAVFPAEAMTHASLRGVLEDRAVVKVAWNAPHDVHSAQNHDVTVRGWVDGLPRARVLLPHLPGHGLKKIAPALLGRELQTYQGTLSLPREKLVDRPACGCRYTQDVIVSTPPERCPDRGKKGHAKVRVRLVQEYLEHVPLEHVHPGHVLHPALVRYAAEDAVAALEAWDWMDRVAVPPRVPPLPWVPEVAGA